MSEQSRKQYWISPSQVAALGVISLSVTVLAFFLGLRVGRGAANQAPVEVVADHGEPRLISEDLEDDTLTELLARVEEAAAARGGEVAAPVELRFSEELDQGELQLDLEEEEVEVGEETVVEGSEPPAEAPTSGFVIPEELPESGWAVQVGSYPEASEADGRLADLQADGHEAFVVAALVDGKTWYRVRVGPFDERAEAAEARESLSDILGQSDLLVTEVR